MKTSILFLGLFLSVSLGISQKTIDDYTIIADSMNTYPSVDEILTMEAFQNKVVFVDIWGTHCRPCLQEFAHGPELKERFRNDSIAFLYLCSPYSMEWDKKNAQLWKDLIVKHELEGIHVFMSGECYEDGFFEKYKEKYTPERLYGIPTYLLVNKQGAIVDFDAPRPSKKEILYDKIQELLDEK